MHSVNSTAAGKINRVYVLTTRGHPHIACHHHRHHHRRARIRTHTRWWQWLIDFFGSKRGSRHTLNRSDMAFASGVIYAMRYYPFETTDTECSKWGTIGNKMSKRTRSSSLIEYSNFVISFGVCACGQWSCGQSLVWCLFFMRHSLPLFLSLFLSLPFSARLRRRPHRIQTLLHGCRSIAITKL